MKLLVLAQIPPPVHGQSLMVQALVTRLPAAGIAVYHANLRLSEDSADIGRWAWRKVVATVASSLRAVAAGRRHRCDTLYYVPAPGKRGALYRDWAAMLICRPFFRRLVLHWHAAGLCDWLAARTRFERAFTRLLLGRSDLSIVLANALRADAEYLQARRIEVVPNGIPDPGPLARTREHHDHWQVLFLGLCVEEKGLFAAAEAVLEANRRLGTPAGRPAFTFVAAGPFADSDVAERFKQLVTCHPTVLRHAGVVDESSKGKLLTASDCLMLPTTYQAEAQPLVVLEALASDLPVVGTRWRGLPEMVPPDCGALVQPRDVGALAASLIALRNAPPPAGTCRTHYLKKFQLAQHLAAISTALSKIDV